MGQTFGEMFRRYDPGAQRGLISRFKAVAWTLCKRYKLHHDRVDDMVQEAFKALIPKEYNFTLEDSVSLVWTVIESKVLDEKRKDRTRPSQLPDSIAYKDDEPEDGELDSPADRVRDIRPSAEAHLISREELQTYVNATEQQIREMEAVLGTRRRDFRDRARTLFKALHVNPEKYLHLSEPDKGVGFYVHAEVLAADLGRTENANNQFIQRLSSVLSEHGLSLERILSGIAARQEADRLGLTPTDLAVE